MFVQRCNNPSLSLVFKSKLADSWTAKEVQVRIDEYQKEEKYKQSKSAAERSFRQAVSVMSNATEKKGELRQKL